MSLVVVSRAPLAEIEAFRKRMGWGFKWLSSNGGDFNYDYHVSFDKDEISKGKVYYNFEMQDVFSEEMPGVSVFYKDANGDIFHTYSSYARGGEGFLGTYSFLDIAPKGRNETGPGHESLRQDFPNMRSIRVLGKKVTGWQLLPADAPDFEEAALRACEFIQTGDPRIGKVPASGRPTKAAKKSRQSR